MPYKDKEKQAESNKLRMRRVRQMGEGIGVTPKENNVLPDKTEYVLPKKPYKLSDGQIHDPSSVPKAVIPVILFEGKKNAIPGHIFTKNIRACNENTKWVGKFNRGVFERLREI